jgi:BirA family biotin operon repressor/biotin-[acetyl-CoA-carboxylase] ligase
MFTQIGQKITRLDRVDSTNNYVANLVREGKIGHGAVILADEQTAGRGQRGAVWDSQPSENMLFSLYVTPANLSVNDQVVLTHFASLSLIEVLRKIGISAEVKWPNDILVDGKKIAGILIENVISSGKIISSIIGIGLNVNQLNFQEIQATSIRFETNKFHSLDSVLFSLLSEMNELWKNIETGNYLFLRNQYLNHFYLLNKQSYFSDKDGEFEGMITGITNEGLLQIDKQSVQHTYDLKEIRFITRNEL